MTRRAWSRASLYVRKVREIFPPTASSILLLCAAFWAHRVYAVEQSDFFVRAIVTMFLLVVFSLTLITITVSVLVRRKLRHLRFSDIQPLVTRGTPIHLRNESGAFKVWPIVEVRILSDEPERYRISQDTEVDARSFTIVPQRRGKLTILRLRFVVGDIFGLTQATIRNNVEINTEVCPRLPRLETPNLKLPNDGDNFAHPSGAIAGDYVEMRRYAPGDPQRFILWKAYARSRKLLVRTPERAQSTEPAVALVLLTSQSDSAAADVTRYFLETTDHPLAFAASGVSSLGYDKTSALDLLNTSGEHSTHLIEPLVEMLRPIVAASSGRLIVIASPHDPSLDSHLDTLAQGLKLDPYVVLASSDTHAIAPSKMMRFGLIRSSTGWDKFREIGATIQRLKTRKVSFEIIDPDSGRRWERHEW